MKFVLDVIPGQASVQYAVLATSHYAPNDSSQRLFNLVPTVSDQDGQDLNGGQNLE